MPRAGSLDLLIADLGKLPPELVRQLRPAMRKAAQPILADAKRRAAWSSRIPDAIKVGVSFTSRRPGVRLVVDSNKAPHARPYEFGSARNRNLRHPVFATSADRMDWRWVEEPVRPFFFPAVRAGQEGVVRQVESAITAASRFGGFR